MLGDIHRYYTWINKIKESVYLIKKHETFVHCILLKVVKLLKKESSDAIEQRYNNLYFSLHSVLGRIKLPVTSYLDFVIQCIMINILLQKVSNVPFLRLGSDLTALIFHVRYLCE